MQAMTSVRPPAPIRCPVAPLVELAGGENVYAGTDQEFLTVNTEDMKTKEPDVILCAAHALPDQVMEMFQEDFRPTISGSISRRCRTTGSITCPMSCSA